MNGSKILVIIRHAHRNKTFGKNADNGLSAKGKKQARAIAKISSQFFGKTKPMIYSSPKVRCIETIEPLAKKFKTEIEILDSLNEAITQSELSDKLRAFNALWRTRPEKIIVACSHGDWIPAFVKLVTGAEIDLEKGGWIQMELKENQTRLRWVIQDPGIF